jgi:hypothetical protein
VGEAGAASVLSPIIIIRVHPRAWAFRSPKFRAGLTPVCRAPVTTCAPFKCKPTRSNSDTGSPMPPAKVRASTILGEFEQAQTELIGKAVILTNGEAGTVESVWLDEMHGLRISIRGHHGKWPVSTIQFAQPG